MSSEFLIDEFDHVWNQLAFDETPPSINQYLLQDQEPGFREHLEKLIAIELEYRWRRYGKIISESPGMDDSRFRPPRLKHYAERFPDLSGRSPFSSGLIAEEYRLRCRFTQRPEHSTILKEWPETQGLAEALCVVDAELLEEAEHVSILASRASCAAIPEIPGYEGLELAGRGGKGVVYRATQRALNRTVAIKALRTPYAADTRDVLRLQKEARLLAAVQHPNLVKVISLEHHGDQWFLIMEFVEGCDLASLVRYERPRPQQVAAWVRDAAQGIHAVHQAGILHRDVKPSNILLDHGGTIRVTDFGLSSHYGGNGERTEELTGTRDLLGTPGYISPEQAAGGSKQLRPATDVYGLGATLYHLLVGRPPFIGDIFEVLRQVRHDDPVPLRKLDAHVPSDIQNIALKCLRKSPAERYPSAAALAEDLQRFLEGRPVTARPLGRVALIGRWCRRNPLVASLISLVVAMALSVAGLLISRSARDRDALVSERQQTAELTEALKRARDANRHVYQSQIRQAYLEYEQNELGNAEAILQRAVPDAGDEDLRGWEWHHLNELLDSSLLHRKLLVERAEWINALAFSPNGELLAVGASVPLFADRHRNTPAALWVINVISGKVVFEVRKDILSIRSICFSPDGRELAVVERDMGYDPQSSEYYGPARIRRWNVQTFDELTTPAAGSQAECVAYSDDGTMLIATESSDGGVGRLVVLPLDESQPSQQFPKENWEFRGSEQAYFTRDATGQTMAWHVESTPMYNTIGDSAGLRSAGERFELHYDATRPGYLRIQASSDQALVQTIHTNPVSLAALNCDETRLIIASGNGEIEVWDTLDWTKRCVFRGHRSKIRSLAVSKDGTRLASGDWEGNLRLWDLTSESSSRILGEAEIGGRLDAFLMLDSDRILAFTATSMELRSIDVQSNVASLRLSIEGRFSANPPGRSIQLAPDGTQAYYSLSGDDEAVIRVVRTAGGGTVRSLVGHQHRIGNLHAGNDLIVSAAWPRVGLNDRYKHQGELFVWNSLGERILSLEIPGARFYRLALSPDGQLLAASVQQVDSRGTLRDSVRIWNTGSGEIIDQFQTAGWALGLAFSPTEPLLAAIDHDNGLLMLRDYQARTARQHDAPAATGINDLQFNPAGTRIAGCTRSHVILWDVDSGRELFHAPLTTLTGDYVFNPQIRFSKDGRQLAASQVDGTIRIFGRRHEAE